MNRSLSDDQPGGHQKKMQLCIVHMMLQQNQVPMEVCCTSLSNATQESAHKKIMNPVHHFCFVTSLRGPGRIQELTAVRKCLTAKFSKVPHTRIWAEMEDGENRSERAVVDGEISNPRSLVAISRNHEKWFPQLIGRVGQLVARHFSG